MYVIGMTVEESLPGQMSWPDTVELTLGRRSTGVHCVDDAL